MHLPRFPPRVWKLPGAHMEMWLRKSLVADTVRVPGIRHPLFLFLPIHR